MAVRIRLMRQGKKKQPVYRVVVADGRTPRDGRYIESIGRYDPRQEPSLIEIDNDRAVDWLQKGAQPSDPVRKLLELSGAWSTFKVARGEIYTVGDTAPAPEPEEPTPPVPDHVPEVHVVGAGPEDGVLEAAPAEGQAEAPAEGQAEAPAEGQAEAPADEPADATADATADDEEAT